MEQSAPSPAVAARITVLINTYNASRHLRRVLQGVSGFDEVLVVDMESTDHTVDIARAAGARVETFPRGDNAIVEPARQFGLQKASCPWVLVVDADEVVTPQLRQWAYAHAARPDAEEAVMIPRRNWFMGREMKSCYPDPVLRFFRREGATWPQTIHAVPRVPGRCLSIDPRRRELALIHLANEGVGEQVRKYERYADYEADRRGPSRHRPLACMMLKAPWAFLRKYLLKGAWRDGAPGLVLSALAAVNEVMINAKIAERRLPPHQP